MERDAISGPTFLLGNIWLELGNGCPLPAGHVLSIWTDPLDMHSTFTSLERASFSADDTDIEQPGGGGRHKRVADVFMQHAVGRKMNPCFVWSGVGVGQSLLLGLLLIAS